MRKWKAASGTPAIPPPGLRDDFAPLQSVGTGNREGKARRRFWFEKERNRRQEIFKLHDLKGLRVGHQRDNWQAGEPSDQRARAEGRTAKNQRGSQDNPLDISRRQVAIPYVFGRRE